MLKITNRIFFLLLGICFFTCCDQIKLQNDINSKYYNDAITFFGDSLTNFFPKKLNDSIIDFSTNVIRNLDFKGFIPISLEVLESYNENEFRELRDSLITKALEVYSSSDTNLLIVKSFPIVPVLKIGNVVIGPEDVYDSIQKRFLINNVLAKSLPTPELDLVKDYPPYTDHKLSGNFKILVLKAEGGIFLDKELIEDCPCMPEEWKHGYSSGVTIDNEMQKMIYWVIKW